MAFSDFGAAICVDGSLWWSCGPGGSRACCFFLASRLTTVSLDTFKPKFRSWLLLIHARGKFIIPPCNEQPEGLSSVCKNSNTVDFIGL